MLTHNEDDIAVWFFSHTQYAQDLGRVELMSLMSHSRIQMLY